MPLPTSINAYTDVANALKTALAAGGATLEFKTSGAATRWRMRAYMYRKLLQQELRIKHNTGAPVATQYDDMLLRLDGNHVHILFHGEPDFTLTSPTGEQMELLDADPTEGLEQLHTTEDDEPTIAAAKRRIMGLKLD